MRQEKRKQIILKRKNFLPSLVITIVLFMFLVSTVFFLDPGESFSVVLFFILTFLFLIFLMSLVLGDKRRGLIYSSLVTVFILLRYYGVGNILNLLLIVGLGIVSETYAHFKK